jgi:hypothetical protein
MEQHNTFQEQLSDVLGQSSKMVARAYISQLHVFFQTIDKDAKDITEQEMHEAVQLDNLSLMFGGTPRIKNKSGRRTNKTTKIESTKTDEGDYPKTKQEGPPSIERCGYVLQFGSRPGHYCNNKSDGKIYELDEGPRRFCERCIKGKNIVRDIVAEKSTTLEAKKGKPGNRRGKPKNNPPEIPSLSKPGDFSSSTPGDAPSQNLIPFMVDEDCKDGSGLYGVGRTDHIVLRDTNGRIGLVATKASDGNLLPPSEESKNWAIDNLVSIINKPELFDEEEEIEEEKIEEEEIEESSPPAKKNHKNEKKETGTPKVKFTNSSASSRPRTGGPLVGKSKLTNARKNTKSSKSVPPPLLDIPGQKNK